MTVPKTTAPLRQLQKRYAINALTISAVIGGGCALTGMPAIGKGIVLGTVFSVLNFILMGEGVVRKFATHGGSSLVPFMIMLGRYGMLAVPIVIAIRHPTFHLPATIAGVFMVQACILIDAFRASVQTATSAPASSVTPPADL